MKCEKCGKEIKAGEKYYTTIGVIQCEDCNTKSNGTVSLDFILNKIQKNEVDKKAIHRIAEDITSNEMKEYENELLVNYKRKLIETTDEDEKARLLRKIELFENN